MWRVIDTGSASAEANMRTDKELLETLEDAAILHLYDWDRPSATYGYFVDPHKLLNVAKAKALGFNTAMLRYTKQPPLAQSEAAR